MIKETFGKKIGMTQMFSSEGELLPVTLVEVEPVCILEKITYANNQKAKIGCFKVKDTKVSKLKKPQRGYFDKIGVPAYKMIKEVGIEENADFSFKEEKKISRYVGIEIFNQGEKITVKSMTKGKGFAGAIKRHRMHRQPSAHGSGMHRRVGSVGASATPSKIAKNKKMPGHLGSGYRVTKNLEIIKVDEENKIIFLKGNISGSRGTVVRLMKQS